MYKEHEAMSDPRELLARAKAGDERAFGALYEIYYTPVFRYAYLRVGNKSEAEDVAQTAFTKVFERGIPFSERGKNPLAYFFTVARNIIIDNARKKKEARFSDFDEGFSETIGEVSHQEHELDTEIRITRIREVMKDLSEDQQEVILQRFFGERSMREIARTLGKSEDAIRQIQSRALKMISKKLETYEGQI